VDGAAPRPGEGASAARLGRPAAARLVAAIAAPAPPARGGTRGTGRSEKKIGAGRKRHIVLVLDNAGWHGPEGLVVPEGISLVFLPPYSPELQPAEHLWPLVDEPVANRHFATLADLEAVIAERCRRLDAQTIKPHTDFHWWPRPTSPH
jgi:transposase